VEDEPELEPEDEPEAKRSHRGRWIAAGVIVLGTCLVLIGWNHAVSSPGFCSSCHSMDDAVFTASKSVHADLTCLSCHTGSGLAGSLRYIPSLAREIVDETTGWNVAHGILDPASCESCHADVHADDAGTPPPEGDQALAARASPRDCATCHGDVAHPSEQEEPEEPHPDAYVQTHGADVAERPASCAQCHETQFCQACHFQTTFPHPEDWIERHGPVQEARGADSCTLCHPTTFCAGCHGTDIPHQPTWLGEHWRQLQDQSAAPCGVCHPPSDCESCHVHHDIHREQDLYV
jgi:hypothetical protein